jgi:hypothetical protein
MAITGLVNSNENYLAPYNHFKEHNNFPSIEIFKVCETAAFATTDKGKNSEHVCIPGIESYKKGLMKKHLLLIPCK